ncbi:MAG TPA: glycosyltransferase [Vicinamibacterales bacterium]
MRILHVIPSVAARYGGPSTAVGQMCRALAAAGHDVTLVATDADGDGTIAAPPADLEAPGLCVRLFPRQWSEAFKYSRPLRRWLDAHVHEFDLVHVHALLSHACLAAAAASRRAGVPYIIRPLGTLDGWSLAQKPWRKRLLLAAGGRRALAGAAAVHYTAAAEQAQVASAFDTRGGFVVPLGLDESLFEKPVPYAARAASPYVLALSRLHPVKALDALIDAFAQRVRHPWRLVIAGDGDPAYVSGLRTLAAGLPGGSDVEFTGWVDGGRKRELLRNASLLALPSHHENFGVSLGEALASATPALVSPHVLVSREIAEAGAGWVCGNAVADLAAGLDRVLADADGRAAASTAARTFAESLAWPCVIERLVREYETVVRGARTADAHQEAAAGGCGTR